MLPGICTSIRVSVPQTIALTIAATASPMVAHIASAINSQTITAVAARIDCLTAPATIGETAPASVAIIVSPTSA